MPSRASRCCSSTSRWSPPSSSTLARRLIENAAPALVAGAVRRSRHARSSQDPRRRAGGARAGRHVRSHGAPPQPVRRPAAARTRADRRRAGVLGARRRPRVRRDRPPDRAGGALRCSASTTSRSCCAATPDYVGLLEDAFDRAGIPGWFERGARRPHPGRPGISRHARLRGRAPVGDPVRRIPVARTGAGRPRRPRAHPSPPMPADDAVTGFARVEAPAEEELEDRTAQRPNAAVDCGRRRSMVVAGALRAPWKWEKLIVDSAVIGGDPERWRRRLRGLRGEFDGQLREAQREDPDSPRVGQHRARHRAISRT